MLNPITYTENVIRDFLRYQLTTYPFTGPGLYEQMRHLLNLDAGRSFAARFFGVDPRQVTLVTEEYDRRQVWAEQRTTPPPLPGSAALHLKNTLEALEEAESETPSQLWARN